MPYVASGYWNQGYVQEIETPLYDLGLELSAGVFTNVVDLCQRASFSRSLADVFAPLGPDEALFELANPVGSLSPLLNTNVIPGRQVRFRATFAGSTYNLYRGRVRQVSVRPAIGEKTAVLEAWTDVNRVDRTLLRTNIIVGTRIASLFTEIMTRTSVLSFNSTALADYVDFAWYQDHNALNALNNLVATGPFESYVDGAGTFQLRERESGIWETGRTAVATVAEALDLNFTLSDREVINQFRLSSTPRQQVTTVGTLAFVGQPLVLPASGSVGFFLTYYDPRNFGVETPVGSIITPVSSQDYYAAQNSDGTGLDFTSTLSVAITSFAQSALCSLFNGTGNVAYVSRFQIRGYPILSGADTRVVTDDASSQALYGLSARNFEDLLIPNLTHLQDYAATLLDAKAEAEKLTDVTLVNTFAPILGVDAGNVLAIQNSLTGVNSFWYVNRITHEIDMTAGLQHRATFNTDFYKGHLAQFCEAAQSDGTSSFLTRGAGLTGATDGKKGIFSCWIFPTNVASPNTKYIFSSNPPNSAFFRAGLLDGLDRRVEIAAVEQGTSAIHLSLISSESLTSSAWHHILASWDVGVIGGGQAALYVDDVKPLMFSNTARNFTLDYTQFDWFVTAGQSLANKSGGAIAELYVNFGEYLDMNKRSNRRKFISPTLKPVDLGSDGSLPTGNVPIVYMNLALNATNANSFGKNFGSGGDFTVTGSLGLAASSPSD